MPRLRLENRSGYHDEDLGRLFSRGLRACGIRKDVTIVVVAAPQRSRGCAVVGGARMTIAIAAPWRFDLRRLACMFRHECEHLKGVEHEQMPHDMLYSLGDTPEWAIGTRLRYRGRAPRQLPLLRADAEPNVDRRTAGRRIDRDQRRHHARHRRDFCDSGCE